MVYSRYPLYGVCDFILSGECDGQSLTRIVTIVLWLWQTHVIIAVLLKIIDIMVSCDYNTAILYTINTSIYKIF